MPEPLQITVQPLPAPLTVSVVGNVPGPAGPAGAAGTPGTAGPPGPAGPAAPAGGPVRVDAVGGGADDYGAVSAVVESRNTTVRLTSRGDARAFSKTAFEFLVEAYGPIGGYDIVRFFDHAGGIASRVDSDGNLYGKGMVTSEGRLTATNNGTFVLESGLGGGGAVAHRVTGRAPHSVEVEWADGVQVLMRLHGYGNGGTGALSVGDVPQPASKLHVRTSGPAVPVAVLEAASGQTAALQEWRAADGTVLGSIDAQGRPVLRAPNGTRYRLDVANDGTLSTTPVP